VPNCRESRSSEFGLRSREALAATEERSSLMAPSEVALPYRTDWREMASVLDYCKGKGADRGALESRFGAGESLRETLNALEQLRLIERGEGGDVRLTTLGEQVAYAPDQSRRRELLVAVLLGYAPYRFPLERAAADDLDLLEGPWVEHVWQVDMRLGQPRNRVEEARTCFFRLADEAGLGTYRRGVRGQTTRLELATDFAERVRPLLQRPGVAPASGPEREPAPVIAEARQPSTASVPARPGQASMPAVGFVPDALPSTPGSAPGSGVTMTLHVDMSDWELDRIEDFLRLIGYLPPDQAR
jgi:hypothetical protein